jgi:hypothetical protein
MLPGRLRPDGQQTGSCPETGFEEIISDVLEADLTQPPRRRTLRVSKRGSGFPNRRSKIPGIALIDFEVLNLPALFALANSHMFSVIYVALSCPGTASFAD